jgi:hypothetical protein
VRLTSKALLPCRLGLQGEYPGIEQRARAEGAEIDWGDETALVNTDVRGMSYFQDRHVRYAA